MAMENKRITQLSTERLTLTSGDYVLVDDADNGSAKYRLDKLKETDTTLSVSGMAADAAATGSAISDEATARELADTAIEEDIDDLKSALSDTSDVITKIGDDNYFRTSISYDGYDSNRSLTSVGKDVTTGSVILSFPVTAGTFIRVSLVNRTGGDILYFFQDQETVPWDSNTHIIGDIHSGSSYTGYLYVPSGATYLVTNADMSNIVSTVANVSYNNALRNVLPIIRVKQIVFNKYGIARDTGVPGAGLNRLHSPLSSCNEGDLVIVPNGYKFCFFYYNKNGYAGNSYDTDGWYETTEPVAIPFTGLFSIVLAKSNEEDFTEAECIALNDTVTIYSSNSVTVNGIEFGAGHIDVSDQPYYWGLHGNDYYFAVWSNQSTLCSTRWRTENKVKFYEGDSIEVKDGYRFYMFTYANETVTNGQWLTGKYVFKEDSTVRILIDTVDSTKTYYAEWEDLKQIIAIFKGYKDTLLLSNDNPANNLSDNESLYIGEFVQGRLVADGISTSDEYYEYRISTPEVVALPRRIGNVHVSINEEYVVAIRCGSEATWLGDNLYWYKNGDTIEIPATANYYAVSVANAVGDTSHMSIKITPSEDIGLTLTMDYKYNVPEHEDAQDILSSARLFFSTSEMNTSDKYAVIGHTSDCHGDYRRVDNFMEFCDIVGADCACITGDIVSYKPSNGIKWFNDILLAHNTLPAVCAGNHDVYDSSMTDAGVYDFMFSDVATKIGNATGKTWYVKDITSKKIRVISVNLYQYGGDNRWYTHFTAEQINWFISVLQTTPADYGVIVLSHASQRILDNAMDSSYPTFFQAERLYNNTHNDVNGAPIYDIVDAFISKTTFEQTYTQTGSPSSLSVSADFTNLNSGVEFIAHLTGHFHQDSVCYVPNTTNKQLMLNVTCTNAIYGGVNYPYLADLQDTGRNKNDATQDGFNMYIIDRDNKIVKVVRVGSNLTYRMAERKYMAIPYADIT